MRWLATLPKPGSTLPRNDQDVGAALPGERRSKPSWDDRDECVEWVVRDLRMLRRRRAHRRCGYNSWAGNQDGAPGSGAFEQHGGWEAMRHAAQRHRRRTG
jgi:hypothetical protein